jgi:TM2 domain-containing membrane protein YozV/predicted transcriptional regulator
MYSVGLAYLLWLLSGFGAMGFHRFYLGKIPSGVLWMCTGGLFTFGSIYDFFTLPRQVRDANMQKAIFNNTMNNHSNNHKSWRTVNDGEARIVNEKESIERIILKIAKENNGIISASKTALAANVSIEAAKKELDVMVSKGFAELRVRQSGTLVYIIPDFHDGSDPFVI